MEFKTLFWRITLSVAMTRKHYGGVGQIKELEPECEISALLPSFFRGKKVMLGGGGGNKQLN